MTLARNTFKQHVPPYIDFRGPISSFEFQTTDELISDNWIKGWQEVEGFYQYSLSDNLLMAEFKGGYEWWVLGYIKFPQLVNLPKWEAKYND